MSSSQHPVALSIERQVGGATRLLATVMCLPLLDGIFPALLLAGALDDPMGIAEVGLLIFGGSATVAVILAEMDGTRPEQVRAVLAVGVVVIGVAAVEAALAPTIQGLLDLAVFERFAGLVILAVAAKTASARVGEWLPRPALIVAAGVIASFQPGGATLALTADVEMILRGTAAAAVGVGFALAVAILAPTLRAAVDIDRFRFGSAVALGVLPLSMFRLIPADAPLALAVLGVTALLAFDPGGHVTPTPESANQESADRLDSVSDSDDATLPDGGAGDRARAVYENLDAGVAAVRRKATDADGDDDQDEVERKPWL